MLISTGTAHGQEVPGWCIHCDLATCRKDVFLSIHCTDHVLHPAFYLFSRQILYQYRVYIPAQYGSGAG
jgi:hypothetical protein